MSAVAASDPRAEAALEGAETPPDLDDGAGLFLAVWDDLQHDRDWTDMGVPLRIRWSTLHAWVTAQRLPEDEAALTIRLIRAMDAEYCSILTRQVSDRMRKDRSA